MRNRRVLAVLFFLFICATGFVLAQPSPAIGQVTIIPAFPPEYTVLDKIPAGSLGTTWQFSEFGFPPVIASRSEIISPFDGSVALMHYVYVPSYHGFTGLSRKYQLEKNYPPGSKVAFFLMLVLQATGNVESTVWVTFFSGQREVGRLTAGYSDMDNPWDLVLARNHAGLIQFDTSGLTESFDSFNIELWNVSWGAQSGAILDEVRFLAGGENVDLKFTVSSPFLLIGKDEQSSGVLLKAVTSAPGTVNFKVGNTLLESVPTSLIDGQNIAEMIWWGGDNTGKLLEDGVHDLTASVGGQSLTHSINIKRIPSLLITFAIPSSGFGKDPTASILPPPPDCFNCLTDFTDEMSKKQPGYVSGVLVGDPVNAVSGNYSLPVIDLRLKSRIPLVLSRVYNSLDKTSGPFGRGWSSLYFTRLENTSATPSLKLSDGSKVLFEKQGDVFVSDPAYGLRLSFSDSTNFWVVTNSQGSEWHFDNIGKIIRMASACCGRGAADALLFEYDSRGYLSKVGNPEGQFFNIANDSNGRITSVTDSAGRIVSYGYDNEGNLISCNDPINRSTIYSYASQSFLTAVTSPGSRTVSIEYKDLRATKITFPDGRFSTFLWDIDGKTTKLTDPKGVEQVYQFDDSWNLKKFSNPGTQNEKDFEITGSFVTGFRNPVGSTRSYGYDAKGLLTSITDSFGNVWNYEYHPEFRKLTKKTDPLGRVWSYSWCPKGNLVSITNPMGGKTTFEYDQWNNVISKTDPLGRIERDEFDADGNRILRHIDPAGGVSSFSYDTRGNLLSVSDQLGRIVRFEYDLRDRLIKTINSDNSFIVHEYDIEGRLVAKVDNFGRRSEFGYDINGRLVSTKNPNGAVFSREFDENGHVVSQTDPLGQQTKLNYSTLGYLTSVEFPDFSTKSFDYDSSGRLISATNEVLAKTSVEYDLEGRRTGLIDPHGNRSEMVYDPVGRLIKTINPNGRTFSFFYDPLDRLIKVERPDGTEVQNEYDAVGNLIKTTDPQGATWSWRYDDLNRTVKTILPNGAASDFSYDPAGQLVGATDPLGRTVKNYYDSAGRLSSHVDSIGGLWKYDYDSVGRLISKTDPMGAIASFDYDLTNNLIKTTDPLGNVGRFEYDIAGRRIAAVDPLGKRSIFSYDNRNRVVFLSDPEARRFSYSYDPAGRPISITEGADRVWQRNFDLTDRIVSANDPMGNSKFYKYDGVGNLLLLTNARGNPTRFEYDSMNRVSLIEYCDGSVATFAYDLSGREISRSGSSGSVAKTWNPLGRVLSETFGPWGKSWRHEYNLVGNRVRSVSPEGDVLKYYYDDADRLTKLEVSGGNLSFAYDGVGRLLEMKRPGGISKYTYDKAGRLLTLSHSKADGKYVLASRKYSYDAAGRCFSVVDEDREETKYFYDGAGWLTSVLYPGKIKVSYEYNGAGDRVKEVTGKRPVLLFSYDDAGRMIKRGNDRFEYDGDGNLAKSIEDGLETLYHWSSDNKLLKVEREIPCKLHSFKGCRKCKKTFQVSEEYGYLPEDWRRVTRKTDGHTFVSVYDRNDESHEYLLTPKALHRDWKFGPFCWKPKLPQLLPLREFVGGPGTDDLVATRYHGKDLWHLTDGFGSTIALANRSGRIVARMNYDVWGNLRWPEKPHHGLPPCKEGDVDDYLDRFEYGRSFENFGFDPWHFGRHYASNLTPYLFAGRHYSPVTGLSFNRNRYYGPSAGRFISADPIGFSGGSNLWAYAGNSPGNFVDSFGLMTTDELAALNRTVGWNSGAFEDTIGWNSGAFEDTIGWNSEAFGDTVNWNSEAFDRTIRLDLDKLWETTRLNLEAFHRTVDLDIPALNQTLGLTPWIMPVFDMSMAVQECRPRKRKPIMLAQTFDPLLLNTDVGTGEYLTLEELADEFERQQALEEYYNKVEGIYDISQSEDLFLEDAKSGVLMFLFGGLSEGEKELHHLLPKELKQYFEKVGLDIEEFKIPLDKATHRLKPRGIHTGSESWNKLWRQFEKSNPNASKQEILDQLELMQRKFGL